MFLADASPTDGPIAPTSLGPAALRLQARFGGIVAPEVVSAVLAECYDRLRARATVTSYLVVLAERGAAARLAQMG